MGVTKQIMKKLCANCKIKIDFDTKGITLTKDIYTEMVYTDIPMLDIISSQE